MLLLRRFAEYTRIVVFEKNCSFGQAQNTFDLVLILLFLCSYKIKVIWKHILTWTNVLKEYFISSIMNFDFS